MQPPNPNPTEQNNTTAEPIGPRGGGSEGEAPQEVSGGRGGGREGGRRSSAKRDLDAQLGGVLHEGGEAGDEHLVSPAQVDRDRERGFRGVGRGRGGNRGGGRGEGGRGNVVKTTTAQYNSLGEDVELSF